MNFSDIFFGSQIFIQDVAPKNIFPWVETGTGMYSLHLFNEIVIPLWAFFEMLFSYFGVVGSRKVQLKLIIASSFFGFIGGNTVIFLIYDIQILPFGVWFVPINFLIMTYAVFRYKLFDLKAIFTELFAFALIIILLVQIVFANSAAELISRAIFLIFVTIFSFLLVRSVGKEVETRKQIEELAKNLQKANARLRDRPGFPGVSGVTNGNHS